MRKGNTLICDYCGVAKEGISFMIGASRKPDWTMIYGTGKMACPDCYVIASKEGNIAIDNHIKAVNAKFCSKI